MNPLLEKIALCVERGKVNMKSPYPPDLKGQEGADELAKEGARRRVVGQSRSSRKA